MGADSAPTETAIRRPGGLHLQPRLVLTDPHHHLTSSVMDEFDALLIPGQHPALSRSGGEHAAWTPGLLSDPAAHRCRCNGRAAH